MAVTRLKRKAKRNIVKAKNKKKKIQRLKFVPVLKNIDVEAVKEEFSKKSSGKKEKAEKAESKTEKKSKAPSKEDKE